MIGLCDQLCVINLCASATHPVVSGCYGIGNTILQGLHMPSAICQSIAFWLAPDGTPYLVPMTHIQFVIENPDLFGVSLEDLRRRYVQYDEPWGCEGIAREEAICDLVRQGWTRIRRYRREYAVNVPELDDHQRTMLAKFASVLLGEGFAGRYEADAYMPMRIVEMRNGRVSNVTVSQVAAWMKLSRDDLGKGAPDVVRQGR
jgi:hypothetical protein